MCGIVAAAAQREVSEILLEGLRRLEDRGYDSAGMALIDNDHELPVVHRWAYDDSVPGVEKDYIPQNVAHSETHPAHG